MCYQPLAPLVLPRPRRIRLPGKRTSVVEMSADGASALSEVTDTLAQTEGLFAHAKAAELRGGANTHADVTHRAGGSIRVTQVSEQEDLSPLERYQRLVSQARDTDFFADPGQERVMAQLDDLYLRLQERPKSLLGNATARQSNRQCRACTFGER